MAAEFQERRRTPRVALEGRQELRLGRRIRARVVDISGSGALLSVDEGVPVGARGRLQISLGGAQFEAQVLIRREQAGVGSGQLLGAVLTPTHARHQEALEQFLRRAGN
jgi:hypothetical protein